MQLILSASVAPEPLAKNGLRFHPHASLQRPGAAEAAKHAR